MTKKERVLAVMKKEQVDMIPAGFWFHYKSDYTVQQMIDEHMKLFRTTDMDIIKIRIPKELKEDILKSTHLTKKLLGL